MAASIYFNREASKGSTYLQVKYKISLLRLFKYWLSIYFPVNNYWCVLFSRGILINGYTFFYKNQIILAEPQCSYRFSKF